MKKILLVLLLLTLIGCQNEVKKAEEENVTYELNANLGDYVQFGSYNGQPLIWQVINTEENSFVLFADKAIDFKSFDTAWSGKAHYTKGGTRLFDTEQDFFNKSYEKSTLLEKQEAFGSNLWRDSTIRQWLNSSTATVEYLNRPTLEASFPLDQGYNLEAGFLSNFSKQEQSYLMETSHKVLIATDYLTDVTNGTEMHKYVWDRSPKNSVLNYELSYYETITDKVFLLSVKELGTWVHENELNYLKTTDVDSESKRISYKYVEYWLRTPYPDRPSTVRTSHGNGTVSSWVANSNEVAIVPALSISKAGLKSLSGTGSYEDPYLIE